MTIAKGLEGIEVDETAISLVEGTLGRLSYRGIPLDTLVTWPFSRVVWLVVNGDEPDDVALRAFEEELAAAAPLSVRDRELLDLLATRPMHPMQVMVAMTTAFEHVPGSFERYGEAAKGFTIAARLTSTIGYLLAKCTGKALPHACTTLNPVERLLHGIGVAKNTELAHAMEVTQILQIEHSFNAGTFAARARAR